MGAAIALPRSRWKTIRTGGNLPARDFSGRAIRGRRERMRFAAQGEFMATSKDKAAKPVGVRASLDHYFGLTDNRTDVRTEAIAGVTTFLTMAYIIFVNPAILANAGMDKGAVFVATCLAAAVCTLVMGLLRQLSDRAGARHGAQRLLRLHHRADLQVHVAAGAGRRVHLRRAVPADLGIHDPRIHHQRDPVQHEARDLGGRRPVPRHHRARAGQDRGRSSGDAGDARQPQGPGPRSCACSASC